MIKLNSLLVWCVGLLLLLGSCESHDEFQPATPDGAVTVRLAAKGMTDGMGVEAESQIHSLQGFRFEDEVLADILDPLTVNEEGVCAIQPSQLRGTVYFLANAEAALQTENFQPGVTTLQEFLNQKASAEAMTAEGILMAGQIELAADMPSPASVSMKRSVARIDLESTFADVEVYSVTMKNMATTGYINEQAGMQAAGTDEAADWTQSFDDVPFKNRKETLAYVCEQGPETHEVEIMVSVRGAWHRLRTQLPAIERNTVYTLKIYGSGADVQVEVLTGDWENGISSESGLEQKGWIDREASQLPEGVTLSERGDTVYIPYLGSQMQLALLSEEGMEVQVNGLVDGATVVPRSFRNATLQRTAVDVSSLKRMPGTHREYIYLDLYKQQIHRGRVVLTFNPNPLKVSGKLAFDANSVCDFNGYADGRLADMTLEDGLTLELKTDEGGPEWARLYQEEEANAYRLEGGWRPNDPEADGRVQTAQLFVKDADGKTVDTYTIKRQNWGLPVVNINGTWWCKYNLRGNVKNFSDQILISNDPVGDGSLGDYLATCTDDEFFALLGDQYQGGNPDGLELKYEDGQFYYEGFQNTAQDFGALDATVMAPSGYEIPDYDDYRFFAWNNNSGLGYGTNAFNNGLGQRVSYTIRERIATFIGGSYGAIHYYDFSYDGAHLVMLGLGHQWEATPGSVAKMMILMATSGVAGRSWYLEGYALDSANRGTTWVKYGSQNAQKTRTIRCVKSEVSYIY